MGDSKKKLSKLGRLFGLGDDDEPSLAVPHLLTTSLVLLADTTKAYEPPPVTLPTVLRAGSVKRASLTRAPPEMPRFRLLDDGSHVHNLRAAKRQEKILNMLKDLLGAKKLRSEAKLAAFEIRDKPPTLMLGLVNYVKQHPHENKVMQLDDFKRVQTPLLPNDERLFVEKYGRCMEVVGKGLYGVVRLAHKDDEVFAVKEFTRRDKELPEKYRKRLTAEFSIMALLKHMNIIRTYDLLKDAKGDYCEVMEYCSGGDLFLLIVSAGRLEYAEADCFFKQLIRGVNYIHDMGVSHRDLKPENLILTQEGVLKITDFGNSECFRMAWEDEIQLSSGVTGSSPYISPECFHQEAYDPRAADIWACGVIYMAMRTGRQLWKIANSSDSFYTEYLEKRKQTGGYEPVEHLKRARCRNVIYSILDPKPERRIKGDQVLKLEWGREIKLCASVTASIE